MFSLENTFKMTSNYTKSYTNGITYKFILMFKNFIFISDSNCEI